MAAHLPQLSGLSTLSVSSGPLHIVVSTVAGTGNKGFKDGKPNEAQFHSPEGLILDPAGNILVADRENHRVRKINHLTGNVSTWAGDGGRGVKDGPLDGASFNRPSCLVADATGNVFVTDQWNHQVRKIDTQNKTIEAFAGTNRQGNSDGPGVFAFFHWPAGSAFDDAGNLYVCDRLNHKVRKISPEGKVSTFGGEGKEGHRDGPLAQALFDHPYGIVFDGNDTLYVSDMGNHRIRKIGLKSGEVSTFAGDGTDGFREGPALQAQFSWPRGLALDGAAKNLYICDQGNNRVRKLTLSTGEVTTVAGSGKEGFRDGDGDTSLFNGPVGIFYDKKSNLLYVSDMGNHAIRKVELGAKTASPRPSGDVVKLLFEGPAHQRDNAVEAVIKSFDKPDVQLHLLQYLNRPEANEVWALLFKQISSHLKR